MDALNELKEVLAENRNVILVGEGIYSVLPDVSPEYHYDRRATVYDLVISTRFLTANIGNRLSHVAQILRKRSRAFLPRIFEKDSENVKRFAAS
jgi:hypothetical protein